jgi:hypothetical protein
VLIRHLWQLKTVVFLHWCLICAVLLQDTNTLAYLTGASVTEEKKFSNIDARSSNVARHIDTIHNVGKVYPCKWCGKEFRSTGGRDMHIQVSIVIKLSHIHCFSGKISWSEGNKGNKVKLLWPMLQNFFRHNFVAIGVISVKIIGKYAASGVNYALKSFIILAPGLLVTIRLTKKK